MKRNDKKCNQKSNKPDQQFTSDYRLHEHVHLLGSSFTD